MTEERKNTTTKTSPIGCGIVTVVVIVVLYVLSIRGALYIEEKSWYAEDPNSTLQTTVRTLTRGYCWPAEFVREKSEAFDHFMQWYLN